MESNDKKKRPIIIRETPEMANWMHPQNDERKQLILERVEALKERISKRRKAEEDKKKEV